MLSLTLKPRTTRLFAATLLGLSALLPLAAHAKDTPKQAAARQAIAAVYKKQEQAFLTRSTASFVSTLAPDYIQYSKDGRKLNRAQTESVFRLTFEQPVDGIQIKVTKAKSKILSLTWRGADAIVISETNFVMVAQANGRTARSENVSVARDYWSPTAKGWKIRQSVERESKTWVNGQRTQ